MLILYLVILAQEPELSFLNRGSYTYIFPSMLLVNIVLQFCLLVVNLVLYSRNDDKCSPIHFDSTFFFFFFWPKSVGTQVCCAYAEIGYEACP